MTDFVCVSLLSPVKRQSYVVGAYIAFILRDFQLHRCGRTNKLYYLIACAAVQWQVQYSNIQIIIYIIALGLYDRIYSDTDDSNACAH